MGEQPWYCRRTQHSEGQLNWFHSPGFDGLHRVNGPSVKASLRIGPSLTYTVYTLKSYTIYTVLCAFSIFKISPTEKNYPNGREHNLQNVQMISNPTTLFNTTYPCPTLKYCKHTYQLQPYCTNKYGFLSYEKIVWKKKYFRMENVW